MRALLALLAVADALQASAPGAVRTRLPALSVRAQAPVELAEGEWGSAPIAAAGPESAEGLMQRVLEWLPDMLVNLEGAVALTDEPADVEAHADEILSAKTAGKAEGAAEAEAEAEDDPDPEDFEFVAVGRPWLHTAAFHLATGATPAELGAAVWAEAEGSAFLRQGGGGGGLLVLVPQLEADFALFEQVGAAVSAAARREINVELQVQECHPNAKTAARRCPVALFQFFTDSPDLYVDGNLADAFK